MTNENQDNQEKPESKPVTIPAKMPEGLAFDHDPFQNDHKQTKNGRDGRND